MTTKITRVLGILTLCLFVTVSALIGTSDAATVFGGSKVIGIDQGQRTITFRTKEGQTWTLPVADPNVLDGKHIAKGDDVTIEINLNDQITKVVKLSEVAPAAPAQAEER